MHKNYKYNEHFINHTNHIRFIKSIAEDLEITFVNPSEKNSTDRDKKTIT